MKTLPEKLSDGLELALADLLKCEEDKGAYMINMGTWHEGATVDEEAEQIVEPCEVCMAGAVMAQSLEVGINESKMPGDFSVDVHHKLLAIDSFREGSVKHAVQLWYNFTPTRREISFDDEHRILEHMVHEDWGIAEYHKNREAFLEGWRAGIVELRKRGL
jgi:hypothetical protein